MLTGENFGRGSSREHAVWALMDENIRVLIGPDFADIFANNATKNGLLLIRLPQKTVSDFVEISTQNPAAKYSVNLEDQQVNVEGQTHHFEIDPFVKHCFLNGLDDISLTLEHEDKIKAHEDRLKREKPWLIKE